MSLLVEAVGRAEVPPLPMPERFAHEVVYFITPGDAPGVPALGTNEYWIRAADAAQALDDGFVEVVSPLAADAKAAIELTDYHERWLEWLVRHGVEHICLRRA